MTLCDRLAALFRAYPNRWIDGRDLAKVGGYAGWRTRVSDLRHAPYSMQIENHTYDVKVNGHTFRKSEYRYIPPTTGTQAELFELSSDGSAPV